MAFAAAAPVLKTLGTYAALAGTDYVINHAAPKLLHHANRYTAKRKNLRKVNKVVRSIEKGYHSTPGRFGRGLASFVAGGAIQKSAKGKKLPAKR